MDLFLLAAHPDGHLPESVISIVRLATVERRLLGEPARRVLGCKLGSIFSIRDASVMAEIEAAVGQRIVHTAMMPIPQKKNERKSVSIASISRPALQALLRT